MFLCALVLISLQSLRKKKKKTLGGETFCSMQACGVVAESKLDEFGRERGLVHSCPFVTTRELAVQNASSARMLLVHP